MKVTGAHQDVRIQDEVTRALEVVKRTARICPDKPFKQSMSETQMLNIPHGWVGAASVVVPCCKFQQLALQFDFKKLRALDRERNVLR